MKILQLRFKNINSLKGENTINFSEKPFSDAGIFAIIGPTGAGKSTILDVITLALFNKTPRTGDLSKNKIDELGAVITKNTDEAYAEIDYETGGKKYRSKWSIHRAKSGKMQDYQMELSEIEKPFFDLKKSEIPAKNSEIIGLNFEQFVKSILLSQGEFAAFLKAGSDERSELLEKITGISIYRQIGKAVFEKHKSEKELSEKYLSQSENLHILSPEQRTEIFSESEKMKLRESQISKQKKEIEHTLSVKNSIKKVNDELIILQKEKSQIEINFQSMKPDLNRLEKHEKFAPWKSEIDSYFRLTSEKNETDSKINFKTKIIAEKSEQKLKFEEFLSLKKNQKTQILRDFEAVKPILNEVRVTENKITGIDQNLKELKVEKIKKDSEIQGFTQNLNELSEKISANNILKDKLEKSLKEQSVLNNLNSEFSLISEKLSHLRKDSENAAISISANFKEKFKTPKNSVETLNQIKNEIQKIITEKNNLLKDLNDFPESVSEIDLKLDKLLSEYNSVEKLKNLTEKYLSLLTKTTKFETDKQILFEKLSAENLKNQNLKNTSEQLSKFITELEIVYQKQNFEKKYDDDRKKLKADEPCFLCGSLHHPYVSAYENHSTETEKLLSAKKKDFKENEAVRLQNEKIISEFQAKIESLSGQIENFQTEIEDIKQDYFSIENSSVFELNVNNISRFQNKLTEIAEAGKKLRFISKSKKILEKFITELRDLEILQEKYNSVEESEKSLNEILLKYSNFYDSKSSFEQQINELSKKLDQFNQNVDLQRKIATKILSDENLKTGKEQILLSMKPEIERLNISVSGKEKQIEILNEEIFQKTNGQKIETIENEFNTKLQIAETEIEKSEKILKDLSNEISAENAVLKKLIEDSEIHFINLEKIKVILKPELEKLNCLNIEEAKQYLLENKMYEEIKFRKEKSEKQVIEISTKINQTTENLSEFKKSDNTDLNIEYLEKTLSEFEREIKEINQKIGTSNNQLAHDDEIQKQFSNLSKLIENQQKETNRWAILNNLIGDAQGKNYAKFAQELTLIQMIAFANRHLKIFFERYYIKKSSTGNSDLLIVDTYLADTERSVKTLSGGESFMVSLALALALSDLAGQNTRIDSLFIDEGFGTLDPEAQEAALAALENLQSKTNRTIGIISHVQALKDRIPVQIQVKKTGNGFSKIILSQ
jgi:exonuclease SbcC